MKRSQIIALAGLSAALGCVAMMLSLLIDVMSLSLGIVAAISLMLPLVGGSVLGAVFSYVSISILSGLFIGLNAIPFILFFGPFTIIGYLVDFRLYDKLHLAKWAKKLIGYVIKGAYYVIAVVALGFIFKEMLISELGEWLKNPWVMLGVVLFAIAFFFLLDFVLHMVFINLRYLIRTRILKIQSSEGKRESKVEDKTGDEDVDVFGVDNDDASEQDEPQEERHEDNSSSRFAHFMEVEKGEDTEEDIKDDKAEDAEENSEAIDNK